ncbi:MAG: GspE/PulE family protein [Candidatus Uhrbacteria bacterium]
MLNAQIIDYLKKEKKVTAEVAEELEGASKQGQRIDRLLLDRRIITEDELLRLHGQFLGLPVITLIGKSIPKTILETLPHSLAERYHAIAFERDGNRVTVGLVDATDQQIVEAIEFYARERQLSVRYAIISESSYRAAMQLYSGAKQKTDRAISEATKQFTAQETDTHTETDISAEIERAPVSQIVATILRHAIEGHASDIHIEPHGDQTRIRYRVDGVLKTTLSLPTALHGAIVSRVKVLAKMRLDETRIPQDGRIHIEEGGREIDLRVSTLPLLENEKVVMRILESSESILTLQDLGFRDWQVEIVDRAVHRPNGMVLLTGPTGSGKSTTLYAVLTMLNQEGVNITTLEDPIEYYVRGVNQAQIRPEVEFTFATGLRAILRQDPNVIMVGEIRDTETAELSVHAGLTGHLLFSTLHTRDVVGVVPRLVDMKIEPFLLASTLIMAEGQRLVRKICPDCREQFVPTKEILAEIERILTELPSKYAVADATVAGGVKLSRGRGCPKCGGTGYRGRTVAVELLEFDDELEDLIVSGYTLDKAEALAKERGMLTISQDALLRAVEGVTSYEEVLRIAHE